MWIVTKNQSDVESSVINVVTGGSISIVGAGPRNDVFVIEAQIGVPKVLFRGTKEDCISAFQNLLKELKPYRLEK